jgi:tol-pal system protein YbgF
VIGVAVLAAALVGPSVGCVTVAEHRKLEKRVMDLQRGQGGGLPRERIADLAVEIDQVTARLRELNGKLEEVDRIAEEALREAQKARREAAAGASSATLGSAGGAASASSRAPGDARAFTMETAPSGASQPTAASPGRSGLGAAIVPTEAEMEAGSNPSSEVRAYQEALASWRTSDYAACIDQFGGFLQTYASSSRADDAAFWIGDCYYRQGEFKQAVVRFDDVARNYPTGNRAPDALYRQGESLLKLGPTFYEAAQRAFERVLKEYPDSARAVEARRQLELRSPS